MSSWVAVDINFGDVESPTCYSYKNMRKKNKEFHLKIVRLSSLMAGWECGSVTKHLPSRRNALGYILNNMKLIN
jgi:hypothetical protein